MDWVWPGVFPQIQASASGSFTSEFLVAEHDAQGRKAFWLQYVDKVSDFRLVLCEEDELRLKATLGSNPIQFARMEGPNKVSAFLLRFTSSQQGDDLVCVEFSRIRSDQGMKSRVREAFGLSKGRLLAEVPSGWSASIVQRVGSTGFLVDQKVTQALAELKESMVQRQPTQVGPFLVQDEAEHHKRNFRAILTTGLRRPDVPMLPFQEVLGEPAWEESRSISWPKRPGVIRQHLSLFAALTTELHVFDPYLDLEKPTSAAFVGELLREVQEQRGREAEHVHVWLHTDASKSRHGFQPEPWAAGLRLMALSVPLAATVCFWDKGGLQARVHNRYVLNNLCGLQFGDSLELNRGWKDCDTVHIMGAQPYREWWSLLKRGKPTASLQLIIPVGDR